MWKKIVHIKSQPLNAAGIFRTSVLLAIGLIAGEILFSQSASAQWKMLFQSDTTTGWNNEFDVIYFLNLPGPPRIGFAGSFGRIQKTTNSGLTWESLKFPFMDQIVDITFKDSATGWFINSFEVYKTTDCGKTWSMLPALSSFDFGITGGIYYDTLTKGLFLTAENGNLVSWDDGQTWQIQIPISRFQGSPAGFAFATSDSGVYCDYYNSWFRTHDGGLSWAPLDIDSPTWQPLAITGTQTYFAFTEWGNVLRTDNTWNSSRVVSTIQPPPNWKTYFSSDCIRGDSNNLFLVTMTKGCYRSTDQGHTWKYLCGMASGSLQIYFWRRFYVKFPYVYLGTVWAPDTIESNHGIFPSQIWSLNVDSMQYFPSGIRFPSGIKDTAVLPGSQLRVNFIPETTDPISLDSGTLTFQFDTSVLDLRQIKLPSNWQLVDSSESNGILRIPFLASDSLPNPILQLIFNTYLSPESSNSTKVYLDSASLFGHRLNCDCQALSILRPDSISHSAPDSVQIHFLLACGDSTILAAMEHQPPFSITSVVPNPASTALAVTGTGVRDPGSDLEFQIFDALGNCVLTQPYPLSTLHFETTLKVSGLPSGIYFLRISSGGYALSRSVSIER